MSLYPDPWNRYQVPGSTRDQVPYGPGPGPGPGHGKAMANTSFWRPLARRLRRETLPRSTPLKFWTHRVRAHRGPGTATAAATTTAAEHSQPAQPPANVRREKISRNLLLRVTPSLQQKWELCRLGLKLIGVMVLHLRDMLSLRTLASGQGWLGVFRRRRRLRRRRRRRPYMGPMGALKMQEHALGRKEEPAAALADALAQGLKDALLRSDKYASISRNYCGRFDGIVAQSRFTGSQTLEMQTII